MNEKTEYECPDCGRIFDLEEGETITSCPSDDCPQHHEMIGLPAPR